ncbi:helix-turn-helix domain-containing protein [Chlorobium sp. N1]|uniref:helix-turn-helix transcriptional regulator n=1 Tax=Chlorobium sp. N1 TaxID=2491138 RepID=UPI0013F15F39|nr:helix-turn-helix domain-containing protein [Chlorobium sp. N1]
MNDLKERIDRVAGGRPSTWMAEALWFEENKRWLDRSAEIALCVLTALQEKHMAQKDLAAVMGVSSQYVSKILKGTENLTLETISKLEHALGVNILTVASRYKAFELAEGSHRAAAGLAFRQESSSSPRSFSAEDATVGYSYYSNESDFRRAS